MHVIQSIFFTYKVELSQILDHDKDSCSLHALNHVQFQQDASLDQEIGQLLLLQQEERNNNSVLPLRPSLFPLVPPSINFVNKDTIEHETTFYPLDMTEWLKWSLSSWFRRE